MFVEVNGARLFFDSVGAHLAITENGPKAKPALLVLHGGPGFDHWGLRFFFDRLADIAQVVYLDHRGNGRSLGGKGSDPTTWTLAQWGDDIRAFCDVLGIARPIVFGQSFGGMVAQSYAARHPNHAGALIFSSTAATMRLEDVLDAFEALGGAEARHAAAQFWTRAHDDDIAAYLKICMPLYNKSPRDPASQGGLFNWAVYRHFSLPAGEIWRMDLRPGLEAVSVPVLVLTGETDPVTPPQRAHEIFEALKPEIRTLLEVPGTGHGTFRDAPDESERVLRRFIRDAGSQSGE
jgi:proline iminopeptidase